MIKYEEQTMQHDNHFSCGLNPILIEIVLPLEDNDYRILQE